MNRWVAPEARRGDVGDSRLTALVATDEQWWLRSLESILDPLGYRARPVATQEGVLLGLASDPPDLIIVQADLADASGVQVCRALRASRHFDPCVPVLLTSGRPFTREQRLAAYQVGAWECYGIPFDVAELVAKLAIFSEAKRDVDRSRAEGLREHATELFTRPALVAVTRGIAALLARSGARPLAAVAIGAEGAVTGDDLVGSGARRVAVDRLARALPLAGRRSDFVGFIRPDAIVVLAPDTGTEGVRRLAERMLAIADSIDSPSGAPASGARRLVAGCAVLPAPSVEVAPDSLLERAEAALEGVRHRGGPVRVELVTS